MLNKINQKKSILEICFGAPALVALFVFIQESDLKISNAPITVFMLRLNRQQDLAEKEFFKTTYGIDLTFTELKVNEIMKLRLF
jgi:hypothetical protein